MKPKFDIIADEASAICAKDIDRIMSYYDPDVVFFDVKPPFQTNGADALRRIWEECLPYFPDSFGESRDLSIIVSGDLAIAHWLNRFTGMEPNHPAMQTCCGSPRSTIGNRWQIVHGMARRSIRTRLKPYSRSNLSPQNL